MARVATFRQGESLARELNVSGASKGKVKGKRGHTWTLWQVALQEERGHLEWDVTIRHKNCGLRSVTRKVVGDKQKLSSDSVITTGLHYYPLLNWPITNTQREAKQAGSLDGIFTEVNFSCFCQQNSQRRSYPNIRQKVAKIMVTQQNLQYLQAPNHSFCKQLRGLLWNG